jgi:hypothetical protein
MKEKDLKWCFAMVNGKLSEIYFYKSQKEKPEIFGHCYIKKEEYSKKEQKMIDTDTKKRNFIWRNKIYKLKLN